MGIGRYFFVKLDLIFCRYKSGHLSLSSVGIYRKCPNFLSILTIRVQIHLMSIWRFSLKNDVRKDENKNEKAARVFLYNIFIAMISISDKIRFVIVK